MSRTGKLPVAIPEKVKASVDGTTVSIEGPKGTLVKSFDNSVEIVIEDNTLKVSPASNSRHSRAMFGTARSIINGMVEGVQNGFEKKVKICGVGYKANLKGKVMDMNFGYSHNIEYTIPEGINVEIDKDNIVHVTGIDKQLVGQVASRIRSFHPLEPYGAGTSKARGLYIIGEHIRIKEGKKTA